MIYLSHNADDSRCLTRLTLNAIIDEALPPEVIEAEETELDDEQVTQPVHTRANKPVLTQILTCTDHNDRIMNIEIDSAATVNYLTHQETISRNFIIGQLSRVSGEDPERIRVDSVFETSVLCVFVCHKFTLFLYYKVL